ncbi:hypothetical protein D9M73_264850 [compost metagenome]
MLHSGRIRKRAEHVEQGTQPQVATRAGSVLHGRVVALREHEADAQAVDAAGHLGGGQVQVNAGSFQQVGTAALARYRAVAVLGHGATGRSQDERRGGGDVEDVGTITTSTDDIDHAIEALQFDLVGQLAHH